MKTFALSTIEFVSVLTRKFAFTVLAALFGIAALGTILYFVLLLLNGHLAWAFFFALPIGYILARVAHWAATVSRGTQGERGQLKAARMRFRDMRLW